MTHNLHGESKGREGALELCWDTKALNISRTPTGPQADARGGKLNVNKLFRVHSSFSFLTGCLCYIVVAIKTGSNYVKAQ